MNTGLCTPTTPHPKEPHHREKYGVQAVSEQKRAANGQVVGQLLAV